MTTLLKDYASIVLFSYQKIAQTHQKLTGLKKCLGSIYENTIFPFELIVYDNGSDLKIQKFLLGELAEKRISMLVLNPPDWGRSFGTLMNRGWNLSGGNFLVKLDTDCRVEKSWLFDGVTAMQAFPEISYWSFMHFSDNQNETFLREVTRAGISVQVHCNSPNKAFMVRRSTWEELGNFPELDANFDENWSYLSRVVPCANIQPPATPRKRKGYWRGMNSSNKWLALPNPTRQKVQVVGDEKITQVGRGTTSSRTPIYFVPLLFGSLEEGQVSVDMPIEENPEEDIEKKASFVDDWEKHPRFVPEIEEATEDGVFRSRLESLKDLTSG